MPLYFFDVIDGVSAPDYTGMDCRDLREARAEAVSVLSAIAADLMRTGQEHSLDMNVREDGSEEPALMVRVTVTVEERLVEGGSGSPPVAGAMPVRRPQ